MGTEIDGSCDAPLTRGHEQNSIGAADDLDVAIVHDYLNQRGGAERVVLALADIWPNAPIYTSLYRSGSTFTEFNGRDIRTTFLDRLPVDRSFRALLPLYAPAFAALAPIDADVVISSSSGWGHMARTTSRALHIVYCHTPARWLLGKQQSASNLAYTAARPTFPILRRIDRRAAARADIYVANSRNVQRKIADAYGIDATVVHPPVETTRYNPTPQGDRVLAVSRLVPYKRVDLAIDAAKKMGVGIDIVGTGPSLAGLQHRAGAGAVFHGAASDATLHRLIQDCWAVCVPGEDDFGIVPVEAQAAGKPVIAYAAGGVLETVIDGVTGVLFDTQEAHAVVAAIERLRTLTVDAAALASHAESFSSARFAREFSSLAQNALLSR